MATIKETFDITGMTCAACSARVEKVTSGVPGVSRAVVNLLKNSMDVEYDGDPNTLAAISKAVDDAGYGAIPKAPGMDATASTGVPAGTAAGAAGRSAMKLRVI
jgi:Cu2+-exporting ATPase